MSNGELPDSYICPFTENCDVYSNWASQQDEEEQIDIIYHSLKGYYCFAKIALTNPEMPGGVLLNPGLEKRLKNKTAGCSWIELMNLFHEMHSLIIPKLKQQKIATKPVQAPTPTAPVTQGGK